MLFGKTLDAVLEEADAADEGCEDFTWAEPVVNYGSGSGGLYEGRVTVHASTLSSALIALGETLDLDGSPATAVNKRRDPRTGGASDLRAAVHIEPWWDNDTGCYMIRASLWYEDDPSL